MQYRPASPDAVDELMVVVQNANRSWVQPFFQGLIGGAAKLMPVVLEKRHPAHFGPLKSLSE